MDEKTPEQIAAEKAAVAQKKADDAAAKAKAKAEAKAAKDAEKASAKAAKEQAKVAADEAKVKVKADAIAAKQKAKDDALAAREANKMPEKNGIRRPKPDGLCGKAWAIFDEVSAKNGAPASISESMEIAKTQGLNEANVRAEYARWRKFFGVSGRVEAPKAPEAAPAAPVAPAAPTA